MGEALTLALIMTFKDEVTEGLGKVSDAIGISPTSLAAAAGVAVLAFGFLKEAASTAFGVLSDWVGDAAEDEVKMTRFGAAVRATGEDWDAVKDAIGGVIEAERKRTGFTDDELVPALVTLTRITGDYKTALDLLPIAEDIARGSGKSLESAANAVGKAYDGTGRSLTAFGVVATEGITPLQQLDKAARQYAGQADSYAETQKGAAEKLTSAWDEFKDAIGETILPGLKGLTNWVVDMAEEYLPEFKRVLAEDVSPVVQGAFAWMDEHVIPILEGIVTWTREKWPEFGVKFQEGLGQVGEEGGAEKIWTDLETSWREHGTTVGALFQNAGGILANEFGIGMRGVTGLADFWTGVLTLDPAAAWAGIKEAWAAGFDVILIGPKGVLTTMKTLVGDRIGEINAKMIEKWAEVKIDTGNWWNKITGTVVEKWDGLRTDVYNEGVSLGRNISGTWEAIKLTVPVAWDVIKGAINVAWEGITGLTEPAWRPVATKLSSIWDDIKTAVSPKWEAIKTAVGDAFDGVKRKVGDIATGAKDTLAGKWDEIKGAASGKWSEINEAVRSKFDEVKGKVGGVVLDVKSGLSSAWDSVKETVTTKWGWIGEEVGRKAGEWWDKYIKAPITSIKDKAVGLWNDIKNALAGVFAGIHIPTPHFTLNWSAPTWTPFGTITYPIGVDVSWYRRGGDFVVGAPTLIGVGEAGAERVQITPLGGGGGRGDNGDLVTAIRALIPALDELVHTMGGNSNAATLLRSLELRARLA